MAESCGFRDEAKNFEARGYALLGASRDTPEVQKAFKEKHNLPYTMASDPKGELAAAFGFKPGERKTAVIGKDGKLEKLYAQVAAATHAKDVLKDLEAKK